MHPIRRVPSIAVALAGVVLAGGFDCGAAIANPVLGFVEHWSTGTAGWGGGDNYSNPGTGGELGAGDGYLAFSTPGPSPFFSLNLGANSSGAAYSGNWVASGITRVQFWLSDIGTPNPLEIHFALGTATNFWQYDTGFIPPAGAWAPFVVDLTNGPTGWTHIINTDSPPGTFNGALQNVSRILVRHDRAPYMQNPDAISADVGLDELALLSNSNVGVPPLTPRASDVVVLAAPWPNPSRAVVTLEFESFDPSPVRVEIADAAGRLVRRVTVALSSGRHRWTWDGRTDTGALASAGMYRARAYNASGGTSRPFVWLGRAGR